MTARRLSRSPLSVPLRALIAAATLAIAAAPASAGVECDRTKRYTLKKHHGPWMIMVAAIQPLRGGNRDGMTPAEAADQVVYDLRAQNIPAYVYAVDTETQSIATRARDGEQQDMLMATRRGGVCVLAGNLKSADDPRTMKALKFIKERAKCPTLDPVAATGGVAKTRSGGFFQVTPGRPRSPLTRAFVTVNPLLSLDEVRRLTPINDPLLKRMNHGQEFSLHKCPGAYSVMIKEFRGKTLTQVSGTKSADLGDRVKLSDDLNAAGREAWELCQILRTRENLEAYVWHDQHRSVVCVGSFSSASDPAAVRIARKFSARRGADGKTTPITIVVPKGETDLRKAKRHWLLEVSPYAMSVPRL